MSADPLADLERVSDVALPRTMTDRHRRVLLYLDLIFGGYCVAIAAAAGVAWLNGRGTLRTAVAVLVFFLGNGVISQVSRQLTRPLWAEGARLVAGAVLAPVAYLATDAPFGMWWPGFMIMGLGGATFFGLWTGSATPGRLVALYYAGVLCLTERAINPTPNWYALLVAAGAIIMVGFLLAEIVALLDRTLSAERQQTEALRQEKARSEQLLQKEAEQALRASEAHFRTLIEHSSDGISIVDARGRFRYLSPAAECILGRTTASVKGEPFEGLVHPDDRDHTNREFLRLLETPAEVRVVEVRIVRPDGSMRSLDVVGRVLPNGEVVGNLRDVTERRQMDRAFRAIVEGTAGTTGEDFFRSLVQHLATALGVDHAFVAEVSDEKPGHVRSVAFWSDGRIVPNIQYALAGTPCAEVVAGRRCFHAEAVQQAFPDDADLIALGAESYLGMPLHDNAGVVRGHIAVLDKRPMQDESFRHEVLAIFAARAGAEIDRQRAERKLRALNVDLEARVEARTAQLQAALDESSRLSTVLETTPDIVGMASLDGRVKYLNRAGRKRLRVPDGDDVENYHMGTFYTDTSLQAVMNVGIPTAMRQGSWFGELVMRTLEGEEIPVSFAGNVHFGSDGTPTYISAIARDLSESQRIAAELKSAKEAAEAASRSKSTFLATMSHEIRTPMNAVIGMTDLLSGTDLSPRQREFVDTIRAGGDALLSVIDDILDFSKIEAGRLELEHRAFNLHTALESTVDLLAPRAAEKDLELVLSIDRSLPAGVIGDAMRLRQILVNLIGNGIKFTDRGEIVVSAADGAGGESSEVELTVSVRDTGIGIPPDRRDQLFTSFGQLDASTTRKYGGTGLGLAISKRLVELMGGTLRVDSDGINGHGTTFQFTVRLGRAAADAAAPFQHIVPSLAGRRVLVVDDNATNRHILGLQLQTWGMLAVEAAVPGEALDLLRRRDRFDLVILDMQMPEMDGVALARAICGHRNGQRLPIIMLTSLGRDLGADAQAVKCFAGRLTKPVKASQLYDAILSAIVGHAGSAEDVNIPPERRPPQRQGRSLRILLAEDMEVNRRFALLALEELGYRASVADNGREVLRLLGEESFDVVLMDVRMPELDGMEATRQIRRQLTSDRQPYIIAMTANAMRGDREACQAAGMDDYLSMPVYLDELRAALERAADRIAGSKRDDVLAKRVELGGVRPVDGPVRRVVGVDGHHAAGTEPTLIQLYLKEAETLLERLRVASNREDQDGVREAAHALKGSSGYVGAAQVADACAAIERLVRTGEPVGESVLSEVERALQRFSRKAQTGANGFRVSPAGV